MSFDIETEQKDTVWINDSTETATFKLMGHRKTGRANTGTYYAIITLKPGESKAIPAEYDSAIRTESPTGVVIGGLCPWLKKEGETSVNLHPCLDYKAIQEKIELQDLANKIKEEEALRKAVQAKAKQGK